MPLFNSLKSDYDPPEDDGGEAPPAFTPQPAQDGSITGILQALARMKQATQEPSPLGDSADLLKKYLAG